MQANELVSGNWYWIRQDDGSLAPFRFHRIKDDEALGLFYVGSMLTTWSLGRVVAEAEMPEEESEKPKK